jgi:hypothetical protein
MRSVVLTLPPNFEHVMARLLLLAPLPQREGGHASHPHPLSRGWAGDGAYTSGIFGQV